MSHSESSGLHGCLTYAFFNDYIVIDTETTGLSYNNDQIIELSALKIVNGKCISEFSALVNPKTPIPLDVANLTGITDEMVSDSPSIDKILPDFLDFVGDANIVGHNVSFDLNFINYNCNLYGLDAIMNDYCDTRWIAYYEIPNAPNYKLGTIANMLNIEQSTAHRALADCYTTYKCYEIIKDTQQEANPRKRTFIHNSFEADSKTVAVNSPQYEIDFRDVTDLKICLTGEFYIGSRNVIEDLLKERGAIIKDSITKTLDILIIGSLGNKNYKDGKHGTKELKALNFISRGVPITIVNENDFFKIIEI